MHNLDRKQLEKIDIKPGRWKRLYRKACWLFSVYLPKRHDAVVLTRNGLLTFDSKDRTTGRILHIYRNHEFPQMMELVEFLREKGMMAGDCGGTVLDVGGYIGMSSTAFLLEKIFDKSLAFEPSPNNYRLLLKNIENNKLQGSLLAFNVALSDQNGELSFELSEKNYGDHRIRNAATAEKGHFREEQRKVINVQARKFDDFLAEHSEIDQNDIRLIWMDVQGHEARFIRGAEQFLTTHPAVPIIMEFWPYAIERSGVSKQEFVALVSRIFKKFYSLDDNTFIEKDISEIATHFDKHTDPDGGTAILLTN